VGYMLDRLSTGVGPLTDTNYRPALLLLFGFVLLGLMAALFIRETYCRYVRVN